MNDVSIFTIMKCKESRNAFIASAVAMYNVSFFTPFLSVILKQYDITDDEIGSCFFLASFPYFIAVLTTPFCVKNTPRKVQFILCFIISAVAFAFMGPSPMLGFPHKLILILIGLFILGFIQALVNIPCLPEAIECFQDKYKIIEGFDNEFDNKLSDCMSSLYSQFYNLAALVGPILGGVCYDLF